MSESFGARLRQRREAQGIALETIADESKIKLSLLQGLERDDVSRWPGGLFRRSFVRAYAQAVGLDPESAVRDFLAAHGDPATGVDPVRAASSNGHYPAVIVAPAPPASESKSDPLAPASQGNVPAPYEPDLQAMAEVCTAFGRVERADEFPPIFEKAARLLDLKGVIVWLWDAMAEELRPALAHGYSQSVLARLPAVTLDSDSATAAAFRSAEARTVENEDGACAALIVPLMVPAGCAGALAMEFNAGVERDSKKAAATRGMATILAALLAQLVGGETAAAIADAADARSRKAASS
jgi:hypothetical protein